MNDKTMILPEDYSTWLADLKKRISGARQRALFSANEEQIRLYHHIGLEILTRQNSQRWGARVIDRLSADLREAFPDMKGLSISNLKYMRFFAQECPDGLMGQQTADQLPWFHIVTILTRIPDISIREWYARQAIHEGWSRVDRGQWTVVSEGVPAISIKCQMPLTEHRSLKKAAYIN